MQFRSIQLGNASLVVAALGGCVDQDAAPNIIDTGETSQEVVSSNGISLNGISLNGISLNGTSLNGISLNGISLNGTSLNGSTLNGSLTSSGQTAKVGSKWTGTLSNGTTLDMRIDSAAQGTGSNADVGMYGVSYNSSSGWQRLCGSNTDGSAVLALAVPGVWNYNLGTTGGGGYTASTTQFTWSCRAKTIAKCVELGYKTWTGRSNHLSSCVRLLRADFCGNGTSYTVDGNTVNLYDNVGLQADAAAWMVEAEWTATGARCISKAKVTRWQQAGNTLPPCATALSTGSTCGTFVNGALLVDEIP